MTGISDFRFLHPHWLWLLPLLWGLLWIYLRHGSRQSMWSRLCDQRLLASMQAAVNAQDSGRGLVAMLVIVSTCACLAAAGPSWRAERGPVLENSGARVIALELSRAMLVEDVKPDRFRHAITAVREILAGEFDGETGLVVFSGAAFVVSPLSRDSATLDSFLDSLKPGMLPVEGSRIDLAIQTSRKLLDASIADNGRILLVTTGSEQPAQAILAASTALEAGYVTSIMAIGSESGGPMLENDGSLSRDASGAYRLAKTDFALLRAISDAGGGLMLSLDQAADRNGLLQSRVTAGMLAAAPSTSRREPANEGFWLVLLALPFALMLFRKNLLWMLFTALLLQPADDARAQDAGDPWRHREKVAYDAYLAGDYDRAAALSRDPILQGSAWYRSGQYQRALESFRLADSALAHYNRGNALARLNRHREAITAYTEALALDQRLDDAHFNKRLLELFLREEKTSEPQDSEDAADDSGAFEPAEQSGSDNRAGIAGDVSSSPGDQQQLGPGLGASLQSGMVDPFEELSAEAERAEQSAVLEYLSQHAVQQQVESWIIELPVTSSELFQRKFQRDYQRQLKQPR